MVAKNLTQFVKKSEIYPSIAPDHKVIYIALSLSNETPRGRGLWKFNNSLLNNEHYVNKIREIYFQTCSYYSELTDKRLFWEMLKMEIRAATISFSKDLAKSTNCREMEITRRLEALDEFICNNTELKWMTNASIGANTIQLITHLVIAYLLSTL